MTNIHINIHVARNTRIHRGRRGRDCMVVGCTNPVYVMVHTIQHYVIKFVRGLRQFGCFLLVLRFPPRIDLTATILLEYCLKWL